MQKPVDPEHNWAFEVAKYYKWAILWSGIIQYSFSKSSYQCGLLQTECRIIADLSQLQGEAKEE